MPLLNWVGCVNRGHVGHREFGVFEGVRRNLLDSPETCGTLVESGAIAGIASSREGAATVGVGVASVATEGGR